MEASQIREITVLAAPLITMGVKAVFNKISPKIPKILLPIICTGLGTLGELIASKTSEGTFNIWYGFGLGTSGVVVRELIDQANKLRISLMTAVPMLLALLLFTGCNTASQKFSTITTESSTNGTVVTTTRTTQGKIWNVVNAKQSVADFHGQNGSVQAFGTGSASQEAQGVAMLEAAGNLTAKIMANMAGIPMAGGTSAGTVAQITQLLQQTNAFSLISSIPNAKLDKDGSSIDVIIPGVEWYMQITTNRNLYICFPDGRCYGLLLPTK